MSGNPPKPPDEKKIKKQREKHEDELEKIKSKNEPKAEAPTDSCQYSTPEILDHLNMNEDGDERLLIDQCKDLFCFDHTGQNWYYWNDNYWRLDKINNIIRSIDKVIAVYGTCVNRLDFEISQLKKTGKDEGIKKLQKSIKALKQRMKELGTIKRKKNVIKLAGSGVNSLGIPGDEWDTNNMLLGCKNGVINLKTGTIQPGKPEMYIRSVSKINYPGIDEPAPIWERFLFDILSEDVEMVEYVQRLLGYGITGHVKEHVIPILWGEHGRNGKSTMLEILKNILGDLAYKAPEDFLIETKNKNSAGPDSPKAALLGKRIAWCSETDKGAKLNTSRIKDLTGGDTVTARLPYAKYPSEFDATHLLLLLTNNKPIIPPEDSALWRRIHLICFELSFVDDVIQSWDRPADKDLPEKLKTELPGILAWLVRGCLEWQKIGLNPPDKVKNATLKYQKDEDVLGYFILDFCEESPILEIQSSVLYRAYKVWCERNGHRPTSHTKFGREIGKKYDKNLKSRITSYVGLDLLPEIKEMREVNDIFNPII